MPLTNRRRVLMAGAAALVGGASAWFVQQRSTTTASELLLAPAAIQSSGVNGLGVIDPQTWAVRVIKAGIKGHSAFIRPGKPHIAFVCAQRPGTVSYEVDLRTGAKSREVQSRPGFHFYGHGAYSADGQTLFTTENDSKNERGVLVARDADTFAVLEVIDTHGVGPHEVVLHNDGKHVIVANGGMKTSPEQGDGYEPYDRESMASSLVIFELSSGKLLDRVELENRYLSIRHLSVSPDGTIAMAIQDQKGADRFSGGPLLCVRKPDGQMVEFIDDAVYKQMRHHTLSVSLSVERGVVATTSPYGNSVVFWDLETGRPLKRFETGEPTGLTLTADERWFVVTTRTGQAHVLDAATLAVQPGRFATSTTSAWGSHLTSAAS